jgi:hypothetical protein
MAENKFHIVNPRCPDLASDLEVSRIFDHWNRLWSNVYSELKIQSPPLVEQFFNCDAMGLLTIGGGFAGSVHFRTFDLRVMPVLELDYFKNYVSAVEGLMKMKIWKVTTGEFFCIDPEIRKTNSKLNFAPVLVGLAARYAFSLGSEALIGPTRKSHGMDKITRNFGATVLLESYIGRHNTPIDFVAVTKKGFTPYPNEHVEAQILNLWSTDSKNSSLPKLELPELDKAA